MATAVTPTNVQKMEFDVTTAEGPCRVTVVTGTLPAGLVANSATQSLSLTALLDPTLNPGQFRKATAMAALAATGANLGAPATPTSAVSFSIDGVEANFDGQSGRTELRVDLTVEVAVGTAAIQRVAFQVTTLAKL
jgi:hypothetical protein